MADRIIPNLSSRLFFNFLCVILSSLFSFSFQISVPFSLMAFKPSSSSRGIGRENLSYFERQRGKEGRKKGKEWDKEEGENKYQLLLL